MKLAVGGLVGVCVLLPASLCFSQQSNPVGSASSLQTAYGTDAASADASAASSPETATAGDNPAPAEPQAHKIGPLEVTVNWRTRAEGWYWFQGPTGNSDYGFWDSLLRIGIGQTGKRFDWFLEGEQPTILGLPNTAVVAAPQGQLGLGGSYYAANSNRTNVANGFVKQGFVDFKHLGAAAVKLGRFEYFDGTEVKPVDPMLAAVVQTRISSRLISNFAFTAVQRSFDGLQFSADSGKNNFTFLGARPTAGVFQAKGMGELDVDTYYGAYTRSVSTGSSAGELRVFALGYIDHRTTVLKTDNRSTAARTADLGKIEIATWGGDYVHVVNSASAGKFDFLVWGVAQTGSWGSLTQRASAFVGEGGWQLPVKQLKPWFSAGYSYGSGDSNATDSKHGTFFQVLTTPRQYARFPFYNMMNNEDAYASLNLKPVSRLSIRSEAHALRLASAADLWYSGGGAFQPQTFGFTGRPSNGARSLANVWDLSADIRITKSLSISPYYGHAWGKTVIDKIYPNNPNGQLVFLETNYHF